MGHPPLDYLFLLLVPASIPSKQVVHQAPEGEGSREALLVPTACCQNCSTQWGTMVGARVRSPVLRQAMPQGSTQNLSLAADRLGSPMLCAHV